MMPDTMKPDMISLLFGAIILDYITMIFFFFKLLTFKIKIKAVGFIHHFFFLLQN